MNELEPEYQQLLQGCQDIHKPEVVMIHCLNQMDFKQIIFQSYKKRSKMYYKPFFYLNGLATTLGMKNPKSLKDNLLKNKTLQKVGEIAKSKNPTLLNLDILPQNKRNDLVICDYETAKYLIDHVASSNIKTMNITLAKQFQQMMNRIQVITGDVIDILNDALVQYQLKEQQARILLLESPKEDKQKIYEMECLAREGVVNTLFSVKPDRIERSGYIYAYADQADIVQFKIKLGRTNKIKRRETEHNSSHAEDNKYLICVPVFDAELAEKFLHRILQQCRYIHYNREFYRLTKERAIDVVKETKRLLDIAIETIYKPAIEDARKNYINGHMRINIEEQPEEDDTEPPIEPDKIQKLIEAVEKLLGDSTYKLLKPDIFKKFIKDIIGKEFESIKRQLSKCNDFKYKSTNKCYKLMR